MRGGKAILARRDGLLLLSNRMSEVASEAHNREREASIERALKQCIEAIVPIAKCSKQMDAKALAYYKKK